MKIAVIGAGRWGSVLIRKFSAELGAENVLVCDKDAAKLAFYNPARTYSDVGRVIGLADAVVVATQPRSHVALATRALWAGKHVLVEKPMALSGEAARQLLALAKERGLTLMTDDTFTYHPGFPETILPSFGLTRASFFWCNEKVSQADDSILWVNGPHPVSLAIRALGMPGRALGKLYGDDTVSISLCYTDDVRAEIFMTWRTKEKVRAFDLSWVGRNGWERLIFNDRNDAVFAQDALDRMCAAFIRRCGPEAPWHDERGVQVVEVLEMVEKAGKQ